MYRQGKLRDDDIKEIVKMAEYQTTSNIGSRKIATIMNENLKWKEEKSELAEQRFVKFYLKILGNQGKLKSFFI